MLLPGGTTPVNCLPAWHADFVRWHDEKVSSGCTVRSRTGTLADVGNVACAPEDMRAKAEANLKARGILRAGDRLSLEEYTVARYVASEVGSGSPEEKVAVAEAARNRARLDGITVNDLLLYRTRSNPSYGYYGPIHAPEEWCLANGQKKGCHPFGRWAATSRDPSVEDLLVARFVLAGQSNFSRGASDQVGPSAGRALGFGNDWMERAGGEIDSEAVKRSYWVGPLPGVNHQHTFLFVKLPSVDPTSTAGRQLVAQAKQAAAAGVPNWTAIAACTAPRRFFGGAPGGVVAACALALGLGLSYFVASRYEDRGALW